MRSLLFRSSNFRLKFSSGKGVVLENKQRREGSGNIFSV